MDPKRERNDATNKRTIERVKRRADGRENGRKTQRKYRTENDRTNDGRRREEEEEDEGIHRNKWRTPRETRPSTHSGHSPVRRRSSRCAALLGSVTIYQGTLILLSFVLFISISLLFRYLSMILIRIAFIQFSHHTLSIEDAGQRSRHKHKAPKALAQEDGP